MRDFDWLTNWRVLVNFVIHVSLWGSIGCLITWLSSPAETTIKSILAGGLLPAISSAVARFMRSPVDLHVADSVKRGYLIRERRH